MANPAFNIANFSAHIKAHGTLQTNKFYVQISPPRLFGPSGISEVMQYRANNVRIPGISLGLEQVFRYGVGPEQKFPTNVNFTDININFVDTDKKDIWKTFSFWFNGIFDYTGVRGSYQPSYKTEYKTYYTTDIRIHVFDNDGKESSVVVLKEAFPTTLSEVGLSWAETNRLYEFSVGFTFREWYFDRYALAPFESGATVGPGATSSVRPERTGSPRPPRSDTYGLGGGTGSGIAGDGSELMRSFPGGG